MYNALMHNLQIQSQDDGTSKLQLRFHEKKNPLLAPGFDPSTFWLSFYCQVILKEDFFGYPKLCPIWITQWLVLYYSINVLSTVLAAAKNIDQDERKKEVSHYSFPHSVVWQIFGLKELEKISLVFQAFEQFASLAWPWNQYYGTDLIGENVNKLNSKLEKLK